MDTPIARTDWVKLPSHGSHPAVDVGLSCRKSLPCKHYIMRCPDGSPKTLYGPSVAQLFIDREIPVPPHFSRYVNSAGEVFWPGEGEIEQRSAPANYPPLRTPDS